MSNKEAGLSPCKKSRKLHLTKNVDFTIRKNNLRDQIRKTSDGVNELLGRVEVFQNATDEKGKKKLNTRLFYQSKMKESDLMAREKFMLG